VTADLTQMVRTPLRQAPNGVWEAVGTLPLDYTEGRAAEAYLERALTSCTDLGSNSVELERWIRDWSSQYHLSTQRSLLLRGFEFDRSLRVLEVGCGCGAITRYLGEAFDSVISIEGSPSRAALARLRTRDQPHVSIVSAPFQDIDFSEPFDLILCVGVLEYSGQFIGGAEPYRSALERFRSLLSSRGILGVAIENQFGLKYFATSREDHTNVMFDGIEGYPRYPSGARTFGRSELIELLREQFARVEMFYPCSDYKLPWAVFSDAFLSMDGAAEALSATPSTDQGRTGKPLFSERLALMELERNRQLPFFANSFLAFASVDAGVSASMPGLGVLFTPHRAPHVRTRTSIVKRQDGRIWAEKAIEGGSEPVVVGRWTLRPTASPWVPGRSVHALVMRRAQARDVTLDEVLAPVRSWLASLPMERTPEGSRVPGRYADALWRNTLLLRDECHFIDLEWEYELSLDPAILVARSCYRFLQDIESLRDAHPALRKGSYSRRIRSVAAAIGVELNKAHVSSFIDLEAELQTVASGRPRALVKRSIWLDVHFTGLVSVGRAVSRLGRRWWHRLRHLGA
jgi:SAM-dependent methyltransferase